MTKSEGVVWGQVVVALRDDDTIRRRCADTEDKTTLFPSVDVGEPTALRRPSRLTAAGSSDPRPPLVWS